MPRTSSRAERSRRVKLLKAAGGGSNDDESSNGASVAAQAKLNHDIASLHNKPKAGRGADAATGKKGSRRSSTPASAPGASSASASFPGGGGSIDAGKKRPRSESCEAVDGSSEAPDAKVDQLVATIEKHDRFFSTMLDMIPEHLVLPAKEVPLSSYSSKYMKNKKGAAPQQNKKEESKKNKKARYAAENQKTVLERQQERAREDAEDNASPEMDTGDGEEGAESEGEEDGLRSEALRWKGMDVGSMDALKKRIEKRIKELQQKRTAAEGSRRAKTAEKRHAQVASKRERKRKGLKSKKKKSSKDEDKDHGLAIGANAVNEATAAKATKPAANGTHSPVMAAEPTLPPLPTVEDVGDIEFSGLRGVAIQNNRQLPPKTGAPGSKMRRLHGLLASAEEKKQRLASLRQSEEGKETARQEIWGDAIRVAGGEELKDNPAALKKMIKRKEKSKAKSAAQWEDRLAGVKKDQVARQAKREDNLNKRKKGGGAVAGAGAEGGAADGDEGVKRQRRAGFEGKKQDFINKEKPSRSFGKDAGGRGGGRGRGRGRGGGRGGRGGRGGGRG